MLSFMSQSSVGEDSPKVQNNPLLDSGASKDIFNNLAHFTNYEQNNNPSMTVELAESSPISITCRGNVGSSTNVCTLLKI